MATPVEYLKSLSTKEALTFVKVSMLHELIAGTAPEEIAIRAQKLFQNDETAMALVLGALAQFGNPTRAPGPVEKNT